MVSLVRIVREPSFNPVDAFLAYSKGTLMPLDRIEREPSFIVDDAFGLNIFISQIDTYKYNNYKHYK